MGEIKILFAGDYCVRYKGVDYMYPEKIAELAKPVKAMTEQFDLSLVNVETVFTDTPTPTKKSGPNLSSPMAALDLLAGYGFTIGAFANNHTMDQGEETAWASWNAVKDRGMLCVGLGRNLEEANIPCRVVRGGKKITIFNFAEHEFVSATRNTMGFAPMDFIENSRLIRQEKQQADYVFAYLHAGCEHCPFPRQKLKQYCRALIAEGADGVIISHPHAPLGMEYYQGKPIVYSLGNFYMAKRNDVVSLWNVGYMADLRISDDGSISVTPIPYEFGNDGGYFRFLEGKEKEAVLAYVDKLSAVMSDENREEHERLCHAWTVAFHKEAMEGYLELFMTDPKYHDDLLLFIRNAFTCESHQDVFGDYYTLLTQGKLGDYDADIVKLRQLQQRPF